LRNKLILENDFSNRINNRHIAVEIYKCDDNSGTVCKAKADIDKLLSLIFFRKHYINEIVELANENNFGQRPISSFDMYHSYFYLKEGYY